MHITNIIRIGLALVKSTTISNSSNALTKLKTDVSTIQKDSDTFEKKRRKPTLINQIDLTAILR